MRGFIGIDAGMFDENLARGCLDNRLLVASQCDGEGSSIHAGIDVSCTRNLKLLETLDRANPRDEFLGDLARRLPEFLGQIERQGQRVLSELHFRRLLDDAPLQFYSVLLTQKLAYLLR